MPAHVPVSSEEIQMCGAAAMLLNASLCLC